MFNSNNVASIIKQDTALNVNLIMSKVLIHFILNNYCLLSEIYHCEITCKSLFLKLVAINYIHSFFSLKLLPLKYRRSVIIFFLNLIGLDSEQKWKQKSKMKFSQLWEFRLGVGKVFDLWASKGSRVWQKGRRFGNPCHKRKK